MQFQYNKEYDVKSILGYHPSTTIQYGMFDRCGGSITKIKMNENGQFLFYWNFWDYGWYYYDDLREDAKTLAQEILRKISPYYFE